MANVRSSVMVLEDVTSKAGRPWHGAVENNPAAGKTAAPVLGFIDPSGNLRYGKVNSSGEQIVSFDSAEVANLSDTGTNAGSLTTQTIVDIPLQNDYVYKGLIYQASCFRDSFFEVVQIDDSAGTPVETIHRKFRTAQGDINVEHNAENLTFTAGSVGVCILRLRGINLDVASTMDAALAVNEIQP